MTKPLNLLTVFLISISALSKVTAFDKQILPVIEKHCFDCHADGMDKGGLDFAKLSRDLSDPATFEVWERIFDRAVNGEMPPAKVKRRPSSADISTFKSVLAPALAKAHESEKGTVLRRLNRREYQNTMNDLFGTSLDLENMLPEDGRSHEFSNVGAALGISMTHLQAYQRAATAVLDAAIAKTADPPKVDVRNHSYEGTREAEDFVGKNWKLLDDGAIVRFNGGGYPTGMMRGTGVSSERAGRYRVSVTGYAYQSDKPISFYVGGTTFRQGSEKPIFGFFSFPPNEPTTIQLDAQIEANYMITIEPHGISDPERYKRKTIDDYKGPGLAVLSVRMEGPILDDFPSRGHQLIFGNMIRREILPRNLSHRTKSWYKPQFEVVTTNEKLDIAHALRRVATAAWRRPVSAAEVKPYSELYEAERRKQDSIEDALRTAVIAMLSSPNFLYFVEGSGKLDDFALASRLSYFLNRTSPDSELRRAARGGRLTEDAELLRAHTESLLKSAHFGRFLTDFTEAWLDLSEMDFTAPDQRLFPEFDPFLRFSMPRETEAFLRELIQSNLPVSNVVKSDFTMLNNRLAEHYDLPAVDGTEIRKVKLSPNTVRGGFLSHGSVLKVSANGTNTSPVMRGVFVMERFLGETPKPPPPGIPGVEPDVRGATTLRELLDKHRNVQSCQSCHIEIDPPGFALESFNPIGGFRERFRSLGEGERVAKQVLGRWVNYRIGPEVDSSGVFPDGRKFSDYRQFRDHLSRQEKTLAKTLVTKFLTFGTGREMGFSDRNEIAGIVEQAGKNQYRVRDLIHLVVQSRIFQEK